MKRQAWGQTRSRLESNPKSEPARTFGSSMSSYANFTKSQHNGAIVQYLARFKKLKESDIVPRAMEIHIIVRRWERPLRILTYDSQTA
ncbi:hypothetical protein BGX21_001524 [Mortierella sp. AD011]|nr:hypothetical protein BGX21_001524 [Mortierella sp. AD011]